jgi:hypothetical protein
MCFSKEFLKNIDLKKCPWADDKIKYFEFYKSQKYKNFMTYTPVTELVSLENRNYFFIQHGRNILHSYFNGIYRNKNILPDFLDHTDNTYLP